MTEKKKFEREYLLKTSPKVLENMLCTPSGLSEWFANDVNIKDDVLTFFWDGDEDSARILSKRPNTRAKFQWLRDEEEGNEYFFEMGYEVDPVTKSVVMTVTDFAEEDDIEDSQLLWDQQISDLRRVLGA